MILEKKQASTSLHPGIAHVLKFVEDKNSFVTVQSFAKHSLLSISRFHAATTLSSATLGSQSGLGSRDLRLRFIIYQLLQATAFVHNQRLCLDPIEPSNVMLDDDMWLFLPVGISDRTCKSAALSYVRQISPKHSPRIDEKKSIGPACKPARSASDLPPAPPSPVQRTFESIERHIGYYEPLTIRWVKGKVSNFEYLMAINHAAGRTMMDPLYHPIIPWVTDFSCYPVHDNGNIYGGLRDLTKTKFRLSKGDAQLETTFKHSDPPHHVPESLSELTYYIYLARRTPLQVLRRVVRDVFVPEHYPHSMGRIFDWTPDECIPEFYFDATVLSSIHKESGLHDIELPSFAPTPAEFIAFHRSVLESDEVSRKLHRWIDLTFGYCLEGAAAINNMNVPLHHTLSSTERSGIDAPDVNKNPGFVMLFDCPHPRRQVAELHRSKTTAITSQEDVNTTEPELFTFKHSNKFSAAPENQGNLKEAYSINNLIALDNPTKAASRLERKNTNNGTASRPDLTRHDNSALLQASDLITNVSNGNFTSDESKNNTRKASFTAGKKSFMRPPADPSMSALRHAGDISLGDDPRCIASIAGIQTQVQQLQFADCFDTSLGAVYSLPQQSVATSVTERAAPVAAGKSSSPAWDADFQENTRSVLAMLEECDTPDADEAAQFIRDAQADDMLAIGCIIAELFTGRPLMNASTAVKFAQRQEPAAQEELIKFIYRQTSDLPLVVRRIIVLLLQPCRTARPRAAEILQACQKEDESRWTNKDYSLQRTGGCTAGYVDFQLMSASRKTAAPAASSDNYSGLTGASATTLPNKLIMYLEAENEKEESSMHRSMRVELMGDYCCGLFPAYFRSVYSFVGELKLCRDGLVRMRIMLNKLDDILNIPLEGLNLAIRHILDVVSDAKPFCDPPEEQNRLAKAYSAGSSGTNNPQWIAIEGKKTLIGEYHRIIDVLGMRLGIEGTEKLLVPKVVDFLNDLTSVEMLEHILRSPLWTVLLLRSGVRCFLRCFLPLLLTYISSGTLHHVSNGVRGLGSVTVPLWAKGEYLEYNMWLSCFPLYVVQEVEQAAMSTIVSLMEPECMGPGLCSRYMLPALLSLIGMPQLAGAGYGHSDAELFSAKDVEAAFDSLASTKVVSRQALNQQDRPDLDDMEDLTLDADGNNERGSNSPVPKDIIDKAKVLPMLEKFVTRHAIYESQDRSVVRTVINLCMQLGDLVVSELILSKIFNSTLPDLVDSLTDVPSPSTVAALMEVVVLLNGILPSLCPETVQKDYLQPARISGMSLPRLLAKLPLAPSWCVADDFEEDSMKFGSVDDYINAQRRHNLHFELCRLIASSSMMAGAETCLEHVIPSVDVFFKNFVNAFGNLPIESKTMAKGFELGAELFLPLAQLTGPEAFYTLVPNLNPRLEMWLVSVGSSIPAKSPPLPANIWPEVTTEVEKEPRKKKGIMGWFSSRIIGSSTPAAAAPTHSLPTPAVYMSTSKPTAMAATGNPEDEFSPVAERTLQNAKTAQSYSASIRKKHAQGAAVDIGQSPTFGTELVQFDTQTPRVPASARQNSTESTADSPYHLMHNDLGAGSSPLAKPLSGIPESDQEPESELPNEMGDRTPMEILPAETPLADGSSRPDLSADMEVEGEDDTSFVSAAEATDATAADADGEAETEDDYNQNVPITPLPDDSSPVPTDDAAQQDEAQPEASTEHGDGDDAHVAADEPAAFTLEHSLPASYFDNREGKLQSRPYMSYQRLMASRRSTRTSVRSGLLGSYSAAKSKTGTSRKGKASTSIFHHDSENADEIENRELYYNEMAWLLGGSGRWNIDQDLKEKTATMQMKAAKMGRYHTNAGSDWNPAAQMSMTSPRMVTDAAADAGSVFQLNMQSNSQWKLEDNPGMIRCMAVNPIESMLLTCSRTGVRLWSLTSHPLVHVSSYTHHSSPPFAAGFLRCGTNAATCDGNIHIWDVETRHTISFLSAATAAGYNTQEKGTGFSSMSIIQPRDGIMPSMGAYGDDQLITTLGATLSYHDLRLNVSGRGIIPVADWIIPQLPAPQGSFISSTTEPLQLTCAASHDNYLFTGSSGGGLWIIDRRMGKVLTSWQAHDGPILKVFFTSPQLRLFALLLLTTRCTLFLLLSMFDS